MTEALQKYAILGYPLAHSLSPGIHNAAFTDKKINAAYETLPIHPSEFPEKIQELKHQAWAGFNVTIPFKQRIIPFLDAIHPLARKIGAVNTIKVDQTGKWRGFNTDYIGFLTPLEPFAASIHSCLIAGAGGAARAVAFGVLEALKPESLTIVNRTLQKARDLIADLNSYQELEYTAGRPDSIPGTGYDLIVNTTSVGMSGFEEGAPFDLKGLFKKETIVYDLIYKPAQTEWLQQAARFGLTTINGWPMLVYQAQAAFEIWTGKRYSDKFLTSLLKRY